MAARGAPKKQTKSDGEAQRRGAYIKFRIVFSGQGRVRGERGGKRGEVGSTAPNQCGGKMSRPGREAARGRWGEKPAEKKNYPPERQGAKNNELRFAARRTVGTAAGWAKQELLGGRAVVGQVVPRPSVA